MSHRTVDALPAAPARTRPLVTLAVAFALAAAGLTATTAPAHAAFPGTNGKIYYSDVTTGDGDIYSVDSDGTGATQLTATADDDTYPTVSPDGSKVLFHRDDGSGLRLFTMNADGTGVTQIATDSSGNAAGFSPDGTRIVYKSTATSLTVINADGTGATPLGVLSFAYGPVWSPDGTKIAYNFFNNIYTINPDGTGATQITSTSGTSSTDPSWSPDGTRITYRLLDFASGAGQVHVVNADGTGDTNISNDATNVSLPRWSPDGTRIAYDNDSDVWTMNPDGTGKALAFTGTVFRTFTDWAPGPPQGDIDVDLAAAPHLGILVPYLKYTVTASNTGPGNVTSATLTVSLPAGRTATNLSAGCTSSPGSVTCTYGSIADGASATSTFRLPIGLLNIGHVNVTATRTASAPTDPDPANDSDSSTCTVVSILLATCP